MAFAMVLTWWWWSIAQLKNFFKFWLRWCWFVQHVLHIDFLSWVTFIRFHWLLSSHYQRLTDQGRSVPVWEIREMISWTYSDRFLPRSDGLWISGHYTWMIHSKTIPGRHFVEKSFIHVQFFEQQRIQIHFSGDSQAFCICFDCFYSFGAVPKNISLNALIIRVLKWTLTSLAPSFELRYLTLSWW